MREIQNLDLANELLDLYKELYRRKYGIDPIIQNSAHAITTFKDLLRKVGEGMTRRLIEQYLSQDGESQWYKRHGHNLVVFQKNIEALSSQIGLKDRSTNPQAAVGVKMALKSWCPKCQRSFILETKNADQCHLVPCGKCQ